MGLAGSGQGCLHRHGPRAHRLQDACGVRATLARPEGRGLTRTPIKESKAPQIASAHLLHGISTPSVRRLRQMFGGHIGGGVGQPANRQSAALFNQGNDSLHHSISGEAPSGSRPEFVRGGWQ